MKIMQRIVAIFLALTMLLALTACGEKGGKKSATNPDHIELGDYVLSYKSACIMEDSNGDDAIVLTLDFTNNSKEADSYGFSLTDFGYQDGGMLLRAEIFVAGDSSEKIDAAQKTKVEPGETIEVRTAYVLDNLKDTVEVEFELMLSDESSKITIDPSSLRREEPKKPDTGDASDAEHIKWDEYELEYKDAYITEDIYGNDALVLTMDFTNNSSEADAYAWCIFECAFQDGVEIDNATVLLDAETWDLVTDDQYKNIQSGKTIEVCSAFVLSNLEDTVEIVFETLSSDHKGKFVIEPSALERKESVGSTVITEGTNASSMEVLDDSTLRDWWDGAWYGWWYMSDCTGDYEGMDGQWWDALADIHIDDDLTGSILLWDEDGARTGPWLCNADVMLLNDGDSLYGTLCAYDGEFVGMELSNVDSSFVDDYENMILINGWFEGESGGYQYFFYLRPWGTLWDDVAADSPDDIPYYYESWYLPLIEAGEQMPDAIEIE